MTFTDASYQNRGPVHVGRVTIHMRGYIWSQKDIYNYNKLKEMEGLELLGELDETVKEAVTALGDQFLDYLKELKMDVSDFEKKDDKKEKPKKKQDSFLEPFFSVGKGAFELLGAFGPSKPKIDEEIKVTCSNCGTKNSQGTASCSKCGDDLIPETAQMKIDRQASKSGANGTVQGTLFAMYKNFKKAHGMIQW